ncbi:Ergosterol biosynthesis ERG4/ERG24 family protein [uncultured virus]|nr:Ergosterol biosynthesis ERG4/ERG24 family protein [uncultured virus]
MKLSKVQSGSSACNNINKEHNTLACDSSLTNEIFNYTENDQIKEQNEMNLNRTESNGVKPIVRTEQDFVWGRNVNVSNRERFLCLFLFLAAPLIVLYSIQTAFYCNYDIFAGITSSCLISHIFDPLELYSALKILLIWMTLQISLALLPDIIHKIFPFYQGGTKCGSVSPAGYIYEYNINGFQAWLISIFLFIVGSYWKCFSLTVIYDNWGALLIIATISSYVLTQFLYTKGAIRPNHIGDRKITRSKFYNLFMGIELNPRIGNFDLKLFFNGRPGIIAWSLINFSFAAAQYQKYGYVSNSMMVVNLLQTLYIGYFFYREAWYLKTLDISHDHFGWMFAFGDLVWLPAMYTLQGLYLVNNPVSLSNENLFLVLLIGLQGFYIFADSNNQKDMFKLKGENMKISGRPPRYIDCSYKTSDGATHESKLLLSGWWGTCRHINYTGDIMLSLAYSMACGYDNIFPYFYVIYLTMLLIHRSIRDEAKCLDKYGEHWKRYCQRVPYRFIPLIY